MHPKKTTLHHKLRHFADHIVDEEMKIYREAGIDIPYRWHSILQIFNEFDKSFTISELAAIQEKTHPDIVFTINQMVKDGMIEEKPDEYDKRKRMISLSEKSRKILPKLVPLWSAVNDATKSWLNEIAPDLWLNLEALNHSLEHTSFYQRIKHIKRNTELKQIKFIPFQELADGHQRVLSYWIDFKSKYFYIKEIENSIQQLPASLKKNETVASMAMNNNQVLGCTIFSRRSFRIAEIVFLFIEEGNRRKHIATHLLEHTIKVSKDLGVSQLIIQSHPKLVAINELLRKNDFVLHTQGLGSIIKYDEFPLIYMKDLG